MVRFSKPARQHASVAPFNIIALHTFALKAIMLMRGLSKRVARHLSTKVTPPKQDGNGMVVVFVSILGLSIAGAVGYRNNDSFRTIVDTNLGKMGISFESKTKPTPIPPVKIEPVLEKPVVVETESASASPEPIPIPSPPVPATVKEPEQNQPEPTLEIIAEEPEPMPLAIEPVPITPAEPLHIKTEPLPIPILPKVPSEVTIDDIKHDIIPNTISELMSQTAITRRELELSILKDLNSLDEQSLRLRLAQLAAEFLERAKWETLRLHQSLKQVEAEMTARYKELMLQQRAELEQEARKEALTLLSRAQHEAALRHEDDVVRFELRLNEALSTQAKTLSVQAEEALMKQAEALQARLQGTFHSL